MSNDISDAPDTFIARFGRGNGQKSASAIITAKNRASTMHQKPQISEAFHHFWPFWPFRTRPMETLKGKNPKARINSLPPRPASVVSILNGQKGQKGQNAREACSLPGFLPWPFARFAEFEKAKNTKIALEPASCACHLAHGEGLPREVCTSCRRPFPACRGAIDLADDNCVHLAHDYACLIAWSERWRRAAREAPAFRQSQPIGTEEGDPMFVDFDASSPKRSRRACPVATLGPRESKACSITRLAASASTGASPFRNGIRATLKTPRRGDDHGLGLDTFIEFCSRAEAANWRRPRCHIGGRMRPIAAMRRRASAPAVALVYSAPGTGPPRSRFLS